MPWCDRVRREMKRHACTQVQCYLRAQTKKTADGGGPRRRRRKNKRENAGGRRKEEEEEEEEEEEVGALDCPLAAAAGAGHSSQATPVPHHCLYAMVRHGVVLEGGTGHQ